jgi:hypothetical protein
MKYIDVKWKHDFANEPIRLISEIGDGEYETRKLEFFDDGKVGFAVGDIHSGGTELGTAPIPSLVEINNQSEFEGTYISSEDFENLWRKCVSAGF